MSTQTMEKLLLTTDGSDGMPSDPQSGETTEEVISVPARTCIKCHQIKPVSEFRKTLNRCRPCQNKASRQMPSQQKIRKRADKRRDQSIKGKAGSLVRAAISYRMVQKPDRCQICDRTGVELEAHHDDYDKPFDVIFVCHKCHMRLPDHSNDVGAQLGVKFDSEKLPYHLIPFEALEEIVKILKYGANKYGERNWEKGMQASRLYSASMRHVTSWWRGRDLDDETSSSHLAHAACCLLFLLELDLTGRLVDDRTKGMIDVSRVRQSDGSD